MSRTIYRQNPDIICTELDDGAILLDLKTKYYYNLNETALSVWQSLTELAEISDIAARMADEYEVEREKAIKSVERILADLSREGLVIAAE